MGCLALAIGLGVEGASTTHSSPLWDPGGAILELGLSCMVITMIHDRWAGCPNGSSCSCVRCSAESIRPGDPRNSRCRGTVEEDVRAGWRHAIAERQLSGSGGGYQRGKFVAQDAGVAADGRRPVSFIPETSGPYPAPVQCSGSSRQSRLQHMPHRIGDVV